MILNAFFKSLGQVGDRDFRGVLLWSLGLTVLLLAAFVYATSYLLGWMLPDSLTLPWIGEVTFLNDVGSTVGVGLGLILSIFLMIPVASLFVGLFLERIADAVEKRHYAHLPKARRVGILESLGESVRFVVLLIFLNLLGIVAYVIFAPLAALVFWLVNGFLLGREYFQLVAMRRLDRKSADKLRRRHGLTIWVGGVLMAIPLSVPLLNILIPILGVATYTHLFHALSAKHPER